MNTDHSLQLQSGYRQIWRIALPISLAMLVPQLNLIINNIFLGHHSQTSLAVASITGVYYLVFAGIGYGLNNGLQTLISRRAGANDPTAIGLVFSQGILVALGISLAGILITLLAAPPLFRALLPAGTAEPSIEFLHIRIFGLPFLFLYQMRNALLVGINQSRFLVAGTAAEAVANIFFDYVLIFGKLGFPQLGFNGAAIASIIAEVTGLVVILLVVRRQRFDAQFALNRGYRPNRKEINRILNISGPLIFQHGMSVLAWLFFYGLIARNTGQTDLAVSTTIRTVFGFFGVSIWAFAATTNTMVSNLLGQGRDGEVMPLVHRITGLSLAVAGCISLLLFLLPHLYLRLYGQAPDFLTTGVPVVRLVSFALVAGAAAAVWLYAVTGTGNSRVTFLIETVTLVFYCCYVYYILEVAKKGVFWGWSSELLYWSLLFGLAFWYMRSEKWRGRGVS